MSHVHKRILRCGGLFLAVVVLGASGAAMAGPTSRENVKFFQGLKHTTFGSGNIDTPGDSLAVITGLGPSGADGVAIELGGPSMSWTATMRDPDPTDTLSNGAYIEFQAVGDLNGTPNQLIATNHFERVAGTVAASASFAPLGAATYAIEIFNHGQLVANIPGRSGTAYFSPFWPDIPDIPWLLWLYFHILCTIDSYSTVVPITVPGIGTFSGDEVRLMAETTVAPTTMPTEIHVLGRSMPSIVFSSEMVMHGMATLGQSHAAALDYFDAHNPIPPGTVRLTAALLDSSLATLSAYTVSAGFPGPEVAAASDSVRSFLNSLGMLYTEGPTTYFGSPTTTDAFIPFATSALVARGGFFTSTLKTQVDSVNTLAVAGQDSAASAYVAATFSTQARPITELVDASAFINVFQSSYARYGSSPTRAHSALWDALGSILTIETGPIGSILGGALMSDLAEGVFGIIAAKPAGGTYRNFPYTPLANSAPDIRAASLYLAPIALAPYGVSLNLGYVAGFDAGLATIDPGGTAAAGASIKAEARGTVNQVPNKSLGVFILTKDPMGSADILASVDFSSIGSPTTRVQVWNGGVMLVDLPGHATASVARISTWYRHLIKLGGGIECYVGHFPTGTLFTIDGNGYTGDELRVLAETTSRINVKTGLIFTASLLPTFTLTSLTASAITGIEPEAVPAVPVVLEQNRPNPFNPETTIEYRLRTPMNVRVDVYGPSGRHVRALWRGMAAAGTNVARWDGRDDRGLPAASGVYLYVVKGTGVHEARRMVLLR